jgi:tRNA modification GTPase
MSYDTIVGISTPPGEGAIGIVRMSGDASLDIIKELFINKNNQHVDKFENRKLTYGMIVDDGTIIDEVLVACMKAPHTFTRENIVEINCHGGVVPIRRIVEALLKKGCRMAEPGEFTKRAFLNGRLDLAQAESIMDMISAKTTKGFDVAYKQMEGALSKTVREIREDLLQILAHVEVNIDYPDEDIEELTYTELLESLNKVQPRIGHLLSSSEAGRIIRDGLSTVIVGKPNVGKSSLLNALLKESRAIVTDIAGTTRDIIEEFLNIDGIPIKIVDTAGIRDTDDVVEKIGVERSKEFFNKADLVLVMLNAGEALTDEDREILSYIHDREVIVLVNKTDLEAKIDYDELSSLVGDHKERIIKMSVTTGEGIEAVEKEISSLVYKGDVKKDESTYVTNIRHKDALEKASQSIADAIQSTEMDMALDFIEVDIKNTYEFLGEISGDTLEENVIDKIFSNFCLGK